MSSIRNNTSKINAAGNNLDGRSLMDLPSFLPKKKKVYLERRGGPTHPSPMCVYDTGLHTRHPHLHLSMVLQPTPSLPNGSITSHLTGDALTHKGGCLVGMRWLVATPLDPIPRLLHTEVLFPDILHVPYAVVARCIVKVFVSQTSGHLWRHHLRRWR